jgi:hypothetical protein
MLRVMRRACAMPGSRSVQSVVQGALHALLGCYNTPVAEGEYPIACMSFSMTHAA